MNLEIVSRAYINCIELEERAQSESSQIAEDLSILRADLHALLMDVLRQNGISFQDRTEAAQIAYHIVETQLKIAR